MLAKRCERGRLPNGCADLDIWLAANILVKGHGADAAIVPASRADELLAVGDAEGCAV